MKILIFLIDLFHTIKNNINSKMHYKRAKAAQIATLKPLNSKRADFIIQSIFKIKNKKSVLIIELNNFHTETLEGLIWHFKTLDFKVYLLLNENLVFANKRAFFANINEMLFILNHPCMQKFDVIFFNTMLISPHICVHELIKPQTKILGIYHTISDILRFNDESNYQKNIYFSLRDLGYKNLFLRGLNLHDFPKKSKNKESNIIYFTSVGFPILHKNFALELNKIAKFLRKNHISNIRFNLIARQKINIQNEFIKTFISPSRAQLDNILKQSHFIFALYDRFAHRHYLQTTTSGMRALGLAYNLPLIINEPFARAFGFNNHNCIIYKSPDSLQIALDSLNNKILKKNLAALDKRLLNQSLYVLDSAIQGQK